MKKLSTLILFITITIFTIAQEKSYSKLERSNIVVKKFKIKEVETAYDLACNFSYFNHKSEGFDSKFLTLPIVHVNDKPASEEKLKSIKISQISNYNFKAGKLISALYGTKGSFGYLKITLHDNQ